MLQQPTSEESVPSSPKAKDSGLATITVDDKRSVKATPTVKTYTFKEVLQASLDYFGGDDLAARTFVTKYALQNLDGDYVEKTPSQMHLRLSKEFARIEAKYDNPMNEKEIYGLLDRFKYIVPQGSPMSGIGNDYKVQSISNCFVIESPADSYGGILMTDQEQVQIMKRSRRSSPGFRSLVRCLWSMHWADGTARGCLAPFPTCGGPTAATRPVPHSRLVAF